MNTSKLKKFAQSTRRKLIGLVSARLDYVLGADSAELRGLEKPLAEVRQLMDQLGREELLEKVAYTWFNRFMALRFMDVNDYHTFRLRVLSPVEGHSQPEILEQAKAGNVDDELKLDRGALEHELSAGEDNKALRRLIVAVCNRYFDVMPFMFEKVSDYTELLMPEDLLSESSVVAETVEAMGAEDCTDVEVIGWLYQFYISEKKDEVFAALKKNVKITPQNIPAATQLFTPNWIVRYMVENSLGRLWLLNRPNSGLKEHMKYFVETEPEKEFLKVESVEEIKLCDPACGSGHILVYAFELLTKIYEEEGYDSGDIPRLILEKNLYGIDIDDRAAALASFALVMKGRGYYRRFFRKGVQPNVISMQNVVFEESDGINLGEFDAYLKSFAGKVNVAEVTALKESFAHAKNFGSLIKPEIAEFDKLWATHDIGEEKYRLGHRHMQGYEKVVQILQQCNYLLPKYHCVVANPPYMGGKGMNGPLGEFVKKKHKETKGDLFACFMARCIDGALKTGYMSMINQHSWMFLSSFEEYRTSIIETKHISSMLHLGPRVFAELAGEVVQSTAFVIQNADSNSKGTYYRLVDEKSGEAKREVLESSAEGKVYRVNQKEFTKIAGAPVAYWVSDKIFSLFENANLLSSLSNAKSGQNTGDNNRFIRAWSEIDYSSINFTCNELEDTETSLFKWYPYNKGGAFRKWYGNRDYVINWSGNGQEIKDYAVKRNNGKHWSRYIQNLDFMLKEGLTWTFISSSKFGIRYTPPGALFDYAGCSLFPNNNNQLHYILGLLTANTAIYFLRLSNPTLNFQPGNIGTIPLPLNIEKNSQEIANICKNCIDIARLEWDSRETSFGFSRSMLLSTNSVTIKESLNITEDKILTGFKELLNKEKLLNELVIDAYGLEQEVDTLITEEDITFFDNELSRDRSHLNIESVIQQFLSYSVGCMLGRYSLDKPGLILVNQGETLQDYLTQIPNPTFMPDEDNIIPIVDGDYFEDDIVARFKQFLKVSFGEEHYEENLKFIEDAIGKDIRKYFLKDFYKDHIKRYKKRPIYWLFSSPKGSFSALIYMHRYQPDTVSRIVSNYLQEYIHKLNGRIRTLENDLVSADTSASAKTKATKEIDKIKKILKELQDYERDIMIPLAQQKIEIDLDDGVKQNYPKFGKALAKVTGLS
jgi:type II restriction/modification system DNA methylase subunit YeeA